MKITLIIFFFNQEVICYYAKNKKKTTINRMYEKLNFFYRYNLREIYDVKEYVCRSEGN